MSVKTTEKAKRAEVHFENQKALCGKFRTFNDSILAFSDHVVNRNEIISIKRNSLGLEVVSKQVLTGGRVSFKN
jgi:hypothetical protein